MEPQLNGIWSLACSEPVRSQLRTSSEQAGVMAGNGVRCRAGKSRRHPDKSAPSRGDLNPI